VKLGPGYWVEENLPRLVEFRQVVGLYKVGSCGTGILDLLIAIADGDKD
jgi:hypothetical protein